MKTLSLLIGLASISILMLTGCEKGTSGSGAAPGGTAAPRAQAGNYTLSGPYNHENLAIFLIHGADRVQGKTYLTLQEAMEQKKVVVHETGNVNELAIENVSDEEVYVQSGDIVKGGQQDRVIALDFIAQAKSGKMPIASFCVEHGRWSQRGGENVVAFSGNSSLLNSKELKIAAKQNMSQSEVWEKVTESQGKLAANANAGPAIQTISGVEQARTPVQQASPAQAQTIEALSETSQRQFAAGQTATFQVGQTLVQSAASPSSLQLTLETKAVQENTEAYIKKLEKIIEGKPDAIGYAFAINGKLNSADVYLSHELFKKLWPKLLKSSAVEAFAELQKDKKFDPPAAAVVTEAMADAEKGKKSEKDVGARVKMVTQETEKNYSFKTYDKAKAGAVVHENWVKK